MFLVLLAATSCVAQVQPKKTAPQPRSKGQVRVVAGIVGPDGAVRYLPRVDIRLMPSEFAKVELTATSDFNTQAEKERAQRDEVLRGLVDARRNALTEASYKYRRELADKLAAFSPSVISLIPSCIAYDRYLAGEAGACDDYLASIREKLYFSNALREFIGSQPIIGIFDPKTFTYAKTPIAAEQTFRLVRIEQFIAIPELSEEAQKALSKESKGQKLGAGQAVPDNISAAAVARFVQDWRKATNTRGLYSIGGRSGLRKYRNLSPDDIRFAVRAMDSALTRERKKLTDAILERHIMEKDAINAHYDQLQASADAKFRAALERLEDDRNKAVAAASVKFRPVASGQTSLQGDFTATVVTGNYYLYAEDTTTDRRYRWMQPLRVATSVPIVELTDANALKSIATSFASTATAVKFPNAKDLTSDERDEYELRYGHRLLKSWSSSAVLHEVLPDAESFMIEDTPLGFGFHVKGRSTVVFNNLRMTDNDVAARFFKEAVSNFLKSVPDDLRNTGGSRAFEAVSVSVMGSTKSFADQYAVGDYFTLTYTFKLSDIESFATEKINAQQLADRGHIRDSRTGRINIQLASAH